MSADTATQSLALTYKGEPVESGRMDSYEVAASIIAFGDYLSVVAKTAYGESIKVRTDVYGFDKSSFIINFALDVIGTVANFFPAPASPQEAIALLIAGSIEAWRHLKGETPESIEVNGDNVEITNHDGVMNIYRADVINIITSEKAGDAVKRFIRHQLDSGVEKVLIGAGKETIAEINQSEAAYFQPVAADKPLYEHVIRIGLIIESAVFKEGNMWKFGDGQNSFLAAIDDKEFLARVDKGMERFGKGDILIVDLEIKQTKSINSLKAERRIKKVVEHKVIKQQDLLD